MWKNKFHITPSKGLLNDPNGLIYWNNEYHIFYQWNPESCDHKYKHWAHLKSSDMINWEILPKAISPVDWFDKDGCYSGSVIIKDNELYIFYTGNVKNNGIRESYQCLAISEDGVNFQKKGPVIHDNDIPRGYTRHFRDPKVFKENDYYKMILGAQRLDLTGTILVYKSDDLINWEFQEEIIKGDFGYMCECPDYLEIDNEKAVIFSPQGIAPQGDLYNNRFQSGYIIRGLYEKEKNSFIELDRGFEFYAPQTYTDEFGKKVLIAWMGMPDELEHPSKEKEDWIYSLTLPRSVEICEGKIFQRPHINLKKLRREKIQVEDIEIQGKLDLKKYNIFGETYELIIHLENPSCNMEIELRKSEEEKTVFSFDANNKKAILNRNNSGAGYKGIRKCRLDKLEKIHIFVDRSSIEIFLNDGEEVFTGSIYPEEESRGIQINGENIKISKVEFYSI